jgi:hypothetical protein
VKLAALHRMILDELLVEFKIGGLSEEKEETLGQAGNLRPRLITQMRTWGTRMRGRSFANDTWIVCG